jgi:hypothetical protein
VGGPAAGGGFAPVAAPAAAPAPSVHVVIVGNVSHGNWVRPTGLLDSATGSTFFRAVCGTTEVSTEGLSAAYHSLDSGSLSHAAGLARELEWLWGRPSEAPALQPWSMPVEPAAGQAEEAASLSFSARMQWTRSRLGL